LSRQLFKESAMDKQYESPSIIDYGRLQELTANNGAPVVTDVPMGTPVGEPNEGTLS